MLVPPESVKRALEFLQREDQSQPGKLTDLPLPQEVLVVV
jgi:hypothetical protein